MADIREEIVLYKRKLERNGNDDKILLILSRLKKLPMTITLLQETGIGKTVNGLRKREGEVSSRAKSLVTKWKEIVNSSENAEESSQSQTKYEKCDIRTMTVERENSYTVYDGDSDDCRTNGSSDYRGLSKTQQSSNHKNKHNSSRTAIMAGQSGNKSFSESNTSHPSQSKFNSKNLQESSEKLIKFSETHKSEKNNTCHKTKYDDNTRRNVSSNSKQELSKSKEKGGKLESASSSSSSSNKPHHKSKHSGNKSGSLDGNSKKSSNKNVTSSKKKKKLMANADEEGFDSTMASFEDCLSLNDMKPKPKKRLLTIPPAKVKSESPSPEKRYKQEPEPLLSTWPKSVPDSNSSSDEEEDSKEFLKKPKTALPEINIECTLPEIQPNYKPLRYNVLDSPPRKKKSSLADVDTSMFMSSKHNRTQVFSGRRNNFLADVPSLYEICIKVLQDNIEGLEFTGGVPFDVLKPVLERCSAQQLYQIEDYNAYLVEDTDELWMLHCQKQFRGEAPEEMETWREFYLRKFDEREAKLKKIAESLSAKQAKQKPVRHTLLAYVDTVAKPPRNVARKQAKYGTGLPSSHPQKSGPPSKATPRPITPSLNANAVASSSTSSGGSIGSSLSGFSSSPASSSQPQKVVKRVAPLMQKTLKFLKNRFRR